MLDCEELGVLTRLYCGPLGIVTVAMLEDPIDGVPELAVLYVVPSMLEEAASEDLPVEEEEL